MRATSDTRGWATGEIVIVANDVGGVGGMERQLQLLVQGTLKAGRSVTVVARTCALEPHPRLTFVRVWCPRRPFALAYPAFFVVATVLCASRRRGLLHTTGAIVANRADLSTVHYCHRAAARALDSPRVSRAGLAYRLNALAAARLSQAGEWWCYRPERVGLLCCVSRGLASEVRVHFSRVATRVRVLPNGVDTCMFPPIRSRVSINVPTWDSMIEIGLRSLSAGTGSAKGCATPLTPLCTVQVGV